MIPRLFVQTSVFPMILITTEATIMSSWHRGDRARGLARGLKASNVAAWAEAQEPVAQPIFPGLQGRNALPRKGIERPRDHGPATMRISKGRQNFASRRPGERRTAIGLPKVEDTSAAQFDRDHKQV